MGTYSKQLRTSVKLSSAAKYFDKTTASDAYSSLTTFKCQIDPLDMYRVDGTRIKIRTMSTAPGVTLPARGAIIVHGQAYLVGDVSVDQWNDENIRNRYVLQGADYIAEVQTISEVLSDTAGTLAYASIDFNKYNTDERDNSDYHPQYHVFFGGSETVPTNSIITAGARSYLVRKSHRTMAGLTDALSNELDDPVIDTATLVDRSYNPITDTYTDTPTAVRCVRVRWQDHFTYLSQGSTKYETGDMQVFVPLSVTPNPSDVVTLPDGDWRVLSVVDLTGYRSLHVRRA